jgi:hypothetical protein
LEVTLRLANSRYRAAALLAAFIAAWPVWQQIRSLRIQSAVMARDTLIMRIAAIELRQSTTRQNIDRITRDFMRTIHPYEYEAVPDINPEMGARSGADRQ